MSRENFAKLPKILAQRCFLLCLIAAACCVAQAQQAKGGPAKSVTGHYEGTAKTGADEAITVAFDLTEKDGEVSGMINSSRGNFPITGGSHKGDAVALAFDAGGGTGTISLKMTEDHLVGTWTTGEDGGPVDVKKVAAPVGDAKGKS